MVDKTRIRTNHHPRLTIGYWELTTREKAWFDYVNEDDGHDFVRYCGVTYDLGQFMSTRGMPEFSPLTAWHGYHSDSFFSGVLVKYAEDTEYVIMATYCN